MKTHPLIQTAEEVRAWLAGRKSQVRTRMKEQPSKADIGFFKIMKKWDPDADIYPWQIGDHVWVRETFTWENDEYVQGYKAHPWEYPPDRYNAEVRYKATEIAADQFHWSSPVTMPQWAARITLEITDVRVERLQSISFPDCKSEGCDENFKEEVEPCAGQDCGGLHFGEKYHFINRWNSKNPKHPWENNDYVWVREMRRIENE